MSMERTLTERLIKIDQTGGQVGRLMDVVFTYKHHSLVIVRQIDFSELYTLPFLLGLAGVARHDGQAWVNHVTHLKVCNCVQFR